MPCCILSGRIFDIIVVNFRNLFLKTRVQYLLMVCRKFLIKHSIRCLLALGMIFIVFQPGFSQSQQTPNELLPLLKKSGNGIERADLLLKLADYYVESEWNYSNKIKVDSALPYLLESKRISDSLRNKGYIYETLRRLGNYYFRCDKTDSASGYYTQLIELQQKAGEQENEAVNWQLFAHKTPFLE